MGESVFSMTALTYFVSSCLFSDERDWYNIFCFVIVSSCARSSCSSNNSYEDDFEGEGVDAGSLLLLFPKPDPVMERMVRFWRAVCNNGRRNIDGRE